MRIRGAFDPARNQDQATLPHAGFPVDVKTCWRRSRIVRSSVFSSRSSSDVRPTERSDISRGASIAQPRSARYAALERKPQLGATCRSASMRSHSQSMRGLAHENQPVQPPVVAEAAMFTASPVAEGRGGVGLVDTTRPLDAARASRPSCGRDPEYPRPARTARSASSSGQSDCRRRHHWRPGDLLLRCRRGSLAALDPSKKLVTHGGRVISGSCPRPALFDDIQVSEPETVASFAT